MTVQERGAGLGDIFTQNTLSAIKAVCQILGLKSPRTTRGGVRVRHEGGWSRAVPYGNQHTSLEFSSWEATAAHTHTHTHADTHTKVASSFLHMLLCERCSHHRPASGDLSPLSAYPADFLTFRSQLRHRTTPARGSQGQARNTQISPFYTEITLYCHLEEPPPPRYATFACSP